MTGGYFSSNANGCRTGNVGVPTVSYRHSLDSRPMDRCTRTATSLLINALVSLLHGRSCPLFPPHPPRLPTLCPSSTLLCVPTYVGLRKTWPPIRSFQTFNPASPLRLSSPSFENKFLFSANRRMVTTDSQNGLPRP
jgi:hypothetical protein